MLDEGNRDETDLPAKVSHVRVVERHPGADVHHVEHMQLVGAEAKPVLLDTRADCLTLNGEERELFEDDRDVVLPGQVPVDVVPVLPGVVPGAGQERAVQIYHIACGRAVILLGDPGFLPPELLADLRDVLDSLLIGDWDGMR